MALSNSFNVAGMLAGMGRVREQTRERAAAGLKDAAEYVLSEAVAIVPLDTGQLSNSGKVTVNPEELTATISFDAPHAVEQHENMNYRHSAGRKAKYLEIPLHQTVDVQRELIVRRLRGERQ